jgi:benzoylformate decarboxylase
MPAAVGVAMAKPGRKVIGLIGDGSAMYSIQALWSAAQMKLPIAFVILKNRRYAALQEFAGVFGFKPGDRLEGTELPDLDFAGLARAQGVEGVRVETAAQLREALASALCSAQPVLVEVEVT